jgi:hypothetical protein
MGYLATLDLDLPDLGRLDEYVTIVKERSVRHDLITDAQHTVLAAARPWHRPWPWPPSRCSLLTHISKTDEGREEQPIAGSKPSKLTFGATPEEVRP